MELQKRFNYFIKEKNLFTAGQKVLLAVSGGVDSVVMAELFYRSGFNVGIAHVNFQLRGKDSDADQQFVQKLAGRYGVPFFSIRMETEQEAVKQKLSIQETARNLRYDWFASVLKNEKYDRVATAHHLNDSIETFFINLMRGTGVSGLRGILPLNENSGIIRPLLFARKTELEQFARREKIRFKKDASNESDDYLRNRIRHHLVPVFMELNPGFEKIMERNMSNLAFGESIVTGKVGEMLQGFGNVVPNAGLKMSRKMLTESGFPREMLMSIVQRYGFNSAQVDDIWQAKASGKQVFSDGYVLTADRGNIILTENQSPQAPQSIKVTDRAVAIPGFKLALRHLKTPGNKKGSMDSGPGYFHLDKAKLIFPLTLRKWVPGDHFYPLGMKGKKKISDFLTDKKISRPEKEKTYVLLSQNEIVCLLGHRIDDRYKVTDDTVEIFRIELVQQDE